MFEQSNPQTKRYEIRLLTVEGEPLLFVATVASDQEAADYAKSLMLRHPCEIAEVWLGMKIIRRL